MTQADQLVEALDHAAKTAGEREPALLTDDGTLIFDNYTRREKLGEIQSALDEGQEVRLVAVIEDPDDDTHTDVEDW